MKVFHILGAGIGGLSIAHLLSNKYPSSKIIVYERNKEIGGQARSSRNEDNKFQEYCWHAFGSSYNNLYKLLGEANLLSRLIPVNKYIYGSQNNDLYIEYNKNFLSILNILNTKLVYEKLGVEFNFNDSLIMLRLYAQIKKWKYINLIDYDKEDDISWEYLIKDIQNKILYKWLIGFSCIYLGMDATQVSAGTILNVARSSTGTNNSPSNDTYKNYDFLIPDGPINERILNPWMEFLKNRNIDFKLNTTITKLEVENNLITHMYINDSSLPINKLYDTIINCLDVSGWTNLLNTIDTINTININDDVFTNYKNDWICLQNKSYQLQTQVLFELNENITWNNKRAIILIFMESPWCLMIRVEQNIWSLPEGELLSCGIGRWDVLSELYNKTGDNMTEDEIAKECWHQMCKYGKNICTDNDIIKSEITLRSIQQVGYKNYRFWPYFFKNGKIQTNEPKFSNNVGCYKLRPYPKDNYLNNVYHVNAYTKQENYNYSNPDLFCMENAASIAFETIKLL